MTVVAVVVVWLAEIEWSSKVPLSERTAAAAISLQCEIHV